jgi:hypothetical protein
VLGVEDQAGQRDDSRAAAVPVPVPGTGEPRIDAALQLLGGLPAQPVAEHAEVFEQVAAELAGVLDELDPDAGSGS